MRDLHDHEDRHGLGQEEIRRSDGLLLPAWISPGPSDGHAADPARRAGAGRVGTLAEPGLGRPASAAHAGGDQRPTEPAELSTAIAASGRWSARLLRRSICIAVQDDTYAERFAPWGPAGTIHVTGSMKYDGAQTDRDNPATRALAALAGLRRTTWSFSPAAPRSRKSRWRSTFFSR